MAAVSDKLNDGTKYWKAKYYDTEGMPELSGEWTVTLKIDGIRQIRDKQDVVCSRGSKPALPHIQALMPQHMRDAELFRQDWSTSMSLKAGTIEPTPEDFYSIEPLDPRLVLHQGAHWTPQQIVGWMQYALSIGHEGVVLRKGNEWVKVVPLRHADIRITGWYEGNGRLKGTFGGFTTNHGRVGGGFSDALRHQIWSILQKSPEQLIGKIIQVAFRERTSIGKLRMPVFDRFRFDKEEECEYGVLDDRTQ
ncbi:hypothetical protein phiV141_22 [Vibrio phage phiV141]|uniref:DNA ligase OB-like domain-containing protein n=1 Tax=Vibrio phage phiV141 TaxID=2723905 RepID=A0A7D7F493_9CAUD|nr:hypothetical protein phiV141_22 [Vibrio phage phiV141]